jgi:uncharacterized protein (TIGR02270 family)
VRSPCYNLRDLAKVDGRVEANLDGLRVAGDAGLAMAVEALEMGDAGEVFALAVLALERRDTDCLRRVLGKVLEDPEDAAGLVSALGWVGAERAQAMMAELLRSQEPVLRGAGIRASAVNRHHPGPALGAALRAKEPRVAAAAARAAGELGRAELTPLLEWHLGSSDEEARFWAAWSGTLLGSERALDALIREAEGGSWRSEAAAATASRAMAAGDRAAWVARLWAGKGRARAAIAAAGASGDCSRRRGRRSGRCAVDPECPAVPEDRSGCRRGALEDHRRGPHARRPGGQATRGLQGWADR